MFSLKSKSWKKLIFLSINSFVANVMGGGNDERRILTGDRL